MREFNDAKNIANASETSGSLVMLAGLFDHSQANIKGCPTVLPGAKSCSTHLEQRSILLGDSSRIQTLPALDIANDNVDASHKSSIAHISDEDMFYLQSRGIDSKKSPLLSLEGMTHEVLGNMPNHPIKNEVHEKIQHFLEERIE